MTPLMKLQLEQSQLRKRLAELLDVETRSAEQDAEMDTLTKRAAALERELSAAIIAHPEPETRQAPDSEERELRSMIERANVGAIFDCALERRAADGVERELQQHYGLAGNQVPLSLLETRAVTPAPAEVGQSQQPIIPMVFPQSVAAFLGIAQPTVAVGEAVFPVLTSGATAQSPAENAAINPTDDTGAFSADVLQPARLQTSFLYSREDRARFAGMDAALRQNLSDALADGLDKAIVAGANGLLTGANLAAHDVNAVTSYALYREQFAYGRVDGKYAVATSDLRVVMGAATFEHASGQYRGASDNTDALMAIVAAGIPVRVSAHVPAAGGSKQNAVVRLGLRSDMVAPIWQGLTLIPDEVTKAAEGQVRITAVLLHAVKILRANGFHKQQVQIA